MPLTIRKAQESDLAVLMKLIPEPHALALEKVKALFLQMSLYSNYSLFLAFKNSVMVAGFSLLIMDNLAHEGAPAGMLDFLFSPEANKESVGKSLISFALEQCSKKACYKMCVANHHLLVQKLLSSDSASFNQHGFAFVKDLGKKEKPAKVFSFLNYGVNIREANKADLKQILGLYKQPDMDDKVLSLKAGEALYLKMSANPQRSPQI